MKIQRVTIDPETASLIAIGRINADRVDATTEEEIAHQKAVDKAEAMQDAAKYAGRVRKRLGLTQAELSLRIGVSIDTIRNWEQGKRCPTGAARSWFKIIDKAPEASLAALDLIYRLSRSDHTDQSQNPVLFHKAVFADLKRWKDPSTPIRAASNS